MKRRISRLFYNFLKRELDKFSSDNIITNEQKNQMMASYDEGYGFSFIKVLLTIGSILIGLGFLLFIASNWDVINTFWKMFIIIGSFTASMVVSYLNEEKHPYRADAFLYLSILIYGASIFLIDQIYNINIEPYNSFLIWAIGALLLSSIYKDIILFTFAHFLVFIFISAGFDDFIVIQGLIMIAALVLGNIYFGHKKILTLSTVIVSEMFLIYLLDFINLDAIFSVIVMFGVGMAMFYTEHKYNYPIVKFMGIVTFGVSGFMMTFKDLWEEYWVIDNGSYLAIPFAIMFVIYLLTLVSRKQVIPLIIIAALILRYYFDTFYDYMPRSLFFVLGGVMIMGMGYYIERYRKDGEEDEKTVAE